MKWNYPFILLILDISQNFSRRILFTYRLKIYLELCDLRIQNNINIAYSNQATLLKTQVKGPVANTWTFAVHFISAQNVKKEDCR